MIYVISSGLSKDILAGDAVEVLDGVIDGVRALSVIDASNSENPVCAKINFDTLEMLGDPINISPMWITNVWRPI